MLIAERFLLLKLFLFQLVSEIFTSKGVLFLSKKQGLCEFLKSDTMFTPGVIAASNLPKSHPCPFPRGNYTIENYIVDESKVPPSPIGKFLLKLSMKDEDDKVLTSLEIEASVKM